MKNPASELAKIRWAKDPRTKEERSLYFSELAKKPRKKKTDLELNKAKKKKNLPKA